MLEWFSWQWLLFSAIGFGVIMIVYYYGTKNAMRIAFWLMRKFEECRQYGEKLGAKVRKVPVTELEEKKDKRRT